jgi:purine nucleosidase
MKTAPQLITLLLFSMTTLANAQTRSPIDIWLDVDTSTGITAVRPRDVDDGLAMLMAFHSPEVAVRGLSVVFGNADLHDEMPIARDIIARFGPKHLTATAGAASAADLGKPNDATNALIAELEQRRLTLVPLGPLTNIASVLKLRPDLANRIDEIVICAARRPGFDFHPPGRPDLKFPDANFEKDVPAMQVLIDAGTPLIFAGYEASCDTWLTRAELDRIALLSPAGKWAAESSDYWLTRWETAMKLPGFNPFDAVTLAYLTHPDKLTSIPVTPEIIPGPDDRAPGRLAAQKPTKHYLLCKPALPTGKHRYITLAAPDLAAIIADRIAARPTPSARP